MLCYAAKQDLIDTLKLIQFCTYSAFVKLQIEHKRTVFSFLWEPLTVCFVSTVLAIVWSKLLDMPDIFEYFIYVAVGFAIWSLLIAKIINRAVASLSTRSADLMTSVRPISSLPVEEIAYSLLNFGAALPLLLFLSIYQYGFSLEHLVLFALGLSLVLTAGIALSLTLGVLAFFYRDTLQLIKAVMRLGFLITPIIWMPDRLGEYRDWIWLNPFYSFIDICRAPLLGESPEVPSYWVSIAITFILSLSSFIVLELTHKKIRARVFHQ